MADAMGLMSSAKGVGRAWAAAIEVVSAFCATPHVSLYDLEAVLGEIVEEADSDLAPPADELVRIVGSRDVSIARNHLAVMTSIQSLYQITDDALDPEIVRDEGVINAALERAVIHAEARARAPIGYPTRWYEAWSGILGSLDEPHFAGEVVLQRLKGVLGNVHIVLPWATAIDIIDRTGDTYTSRMDGLRAILDICLDHYSNWPQNQATFARDCKSFFVENWSTMDTLLDDCAKDAAKAFNNFILKPSVSLGDLRRDLVECVGRKRSKLAPWTTIIEFVGGLPEDEKYKFLRTMHSIILSVYEISIALKFSQITRSETFC